MKNCVKHFFLKNCHIITLVQPLSHFKESRFPSSTKLWHLACNFRKLNKQKKTKAHKSRCKSPNHSFLGAKLHEKQQRQESVTSRGYKHPNFSKCVTTSIAGFNHWLKSSCFFLNAREKSWFTLLSPRKWLLSLADLMMSWEGERRCCCGRCNAPLSLESGSFLVVTKVLKLHLAEILQ